MLPYVISSDVFVFPFQAVVDDNNPDALASYALHVTRNNVQVQMGVSFSCSVIDLKSIKSENVAHLYRK